jgi:predicted aspartyl protease
MPKAQADVIIAAGGTPPNSVTGWALIDTGANVSGIDEQVAAQLGLQTTGPKKVHGIGGPGTANEHIVQIRLSGSGTALWLVVSAKLQGAGNIALIGTDILTECVFVFDGPNGTFSLSW